MQNPLADLWDERPQSSGRTFSLDEVTEVEWWRSLGLAFHRRTGIQLTHAILPSSVPFPKLESYEGRCDLKSP